MGFYPVRQGSIPWRATFVSAALPPDPWETPDCALAVVIAKFLARPWRRFDGLVQGQVRRVGSHVQRHHLPKNMRDATLVGAWSLRLLFRRRCPRVAGPMVKRIMPVFYPVR